MTSISFDDFLNETYSPFELLELEIKGKLLTMINNKIKLNDWKQKQAAEALGVSQPRVSNIQNLQHAKFSIEALMKFADILGCDISVDTEKNLNISISEK